MTSQTVGSAMNNLALLLRGDQKSSLAGTESGGVSVGSNDEEATTALELHKKLQSQSPRDRLQGMKALMALLVLGRHEEASQYYADAIKLVGVVEEQHAELRSLLSLFVVRYAASNPELALLCVNSFHKRMSARNPRTRGLALKGMTKIPLPLILPLSLLSLDAAVQDSSAYVRKTALLAMPRLARLGDAAARQQMRQQIKRLLSKETNVTVLGSAAFAVQQIALAFDDVPRDAEDGAWTLLHGAYRRLVRALPDMDYAAQSTTLSLLLRYASAHFACPWRVKQTDDTAADTDGSTDTDSADTDGATYADDGSNDKSGLTGDHQLLLKVVESLSFSQSPAVLVQCMQVWYYLAPRAEAKQYLPDLLLNALSLGDSAEETLVVLAAAATLSNEWPELFEHILPRFFVYAEDLQALHVTQLKLAVMSNAASEHNVHDVLREMDSCIRGGNTEVAVAAVSALVHAAQRVPTVAPRCVATLLRVIDAADADVASAAVQAIRKLLRAVNDMSGQKQQQEQQQEQQQHPLAGVVAALVLKLRNISDDRARAAIVWIIGEYRHAVPKLVPKVLRRLLVGFVDEESETRLQILNLAVKVFLWRPQEGDNAKCFRYAIDVAKYDTNDDVRDRARLVRGVFLKKSKKKSDSDEDINVEGVIGSLAHCSGHTTQHYESLPVLLTGSSDEVRADAVVSASSSLVGTPVKSAKSSVSHESAIKTASSFGVDQLDDDDFWATGEEQEQPAPPQDDSDDEVHNWSDADGFEDIDDDGFDSFSDSDTDNNDDSHAVSSAETPRADEGEDSANEAEQEQPHDDDDHSDLEVGDTTDFQHSDGSEDEFGLV
ncbi:MAG: hypothetical protein MHM6MM_005613 [Cercozoa sp. M6MM]